MEYTNSLIKELIREHIHSDRDRRILYDRLVNIAKHGTHRLSCR